MTYAQSRQLAEWYGCHTANIQKMIAHEDWCMWRRLEEKLIYMPKVNLSFTEQFSGNNTDEAVEGYIQSDLRTRCLALLSALDSINSNDS